MDRSTHCDLVRPPLPGEVCAAVSEGAAGAGEAPSSSVSVAQSTGSRNPSAESSPPSPVSALDSPDPATLFDSFTLGIGIDPFPAVPTSPPTGSARAGEVLTVDIGPPGEAVAVRLAMKDVLQYPDSLLCRFMQHREQFRPGGSFERDPQVFLQSVKPFYERGVIPLQTPAQLPLVEEEFAFFGLPFDTDAVVLPRVGETIVFRFNHFALRLYHQRMLPVLQRRIRELKGSHEFTVQDLGMETVEPDFFQRAFSSPPFCFHVMCKFEKRHETFVNIFQVSIPVRPVEGSEAHTLWTALNRNLDLTVQHLLQALQRRSGADWMASLFPLQQIYPHAPDRHCSDIIIRKLKIEHQVQVEEWGISPFPPSVTCSTSCPHSPPCPGTCDGNSVPEVHQRAGSST